LLTPHVRHKLAALRLL